MYRARVEQVNGINVRAGGKWLRCIGNRTVHVGDMVYTDGKVVYGYDKESMTPPVIVAPKNDSICVPVFISRKNVTYYQKNKLIFTDPEIDNLPSDDFLFFCPKNSVYIYSQSGLNIVHSANCNLKKNIYKICSVPEFDDTDDNLVTHRISRISIKKDSNTLFNLDVSQKADIVMEDSQSLVQSLGVDYSKTVAFDGTDIMWSFIESERNWAFLLLLSGESQSQNGAFEGVVSKGLYFDSSGVSTELFSYNHSLLTGWNWLNTRSIQSVEFVDNGFVGHKFPCQDGYYFTVDSTCDLPGYLHGVSDFGTITIYSPQDIPLCSFIFVLIPHITVLRLKCNQYLIGIFPPFQYVRAWHNRLSCYVSDEYGVYPPIPNGTLNSNQTLYLCDNGKLTSINSHSNCSRLNSIKMKSGWYNKIEEITV